MGKFFEIIEWFINMIRRDCEKAQRERELELIKQEREKNAKEIKSLDPSAKLNELNRK